MIAETMNKALGRTVTCALAAALALALALPAAAEDVDFYVQYNAGATWVPHQNLTAADASGISNSTGQLFSGRTESNVGFVVGGAIGAHYLDFFRTELEFMYRQNEVTEMSIQGGRKKASGHVALMSVMANTYAEYDFDIGIIPYVGLGIGWGQVTLDAKNRELPETAKVEGDDAVFVYSFMAGGTIPINEVIDISVGYRYIRTTDSEMDASLSDSTAPFPPTPTQRRARRLDYEYDAHEGIVGLRVNF